MSRLFQASPWIWSWLVWGRSQRVLPWPSWVASPGCDYTMKPTEASGSAETQGHMMFLLFLHPTGPWLSLGRGLELNTGPVFPIFFHLVVTVQKVTQESSVGRRELGQKLRADAPAKEQSPGHLFLLKINSGWGATAAGQAGGCPALCGSHVKRHQQGVPETHTWQQAPSAFSVLSQLPRTKAQGLQDIAPSRPWAKDDPTEESQDLSSRWRQWQV